MSLGKKNNPILSLYLDKYYNLLQKKLTDISSAGFLVTEISQLLSYTENRNFILNADISSLINVLHLEIVEKKSQGLKSADFYIDKLQKEITFLVSGEHEKLTMNQGKKIGDTNIRLTDIDNNPYAHLEAHPDHKHTGGSLSWGEKSEKEWLEVYAKTFDALKIIDEGFYDELNQIISKIIPLGTSYGLHNSCSHRDTVGHLYMGYTIDADYPEFNNVEAVIHESSHNKLNLIMQSEKIILSDYAERYYSPYRPDARHIHGVYIGLHAFAPVIYVLMSAYKKGLLGTSRNWYEKILFYHLKNKIAYRVLVKHGKFSDLGNEILVEMKHVMELTEKICNSLEGAQETMALVLEFEKQHFRKVNINYPQLEY